MKTKVESNQLTCPKWNNTINNQSGRDGRLSKKETNTCQQSGMLLAPIRLPHQGMYLAPITSQHLHILNQSQRLGYVSGTNQIAVYISHSHITAKGYLGPVTAFGNCFLANGLMELGGCTQRIEKNCTFWAQL